MPATESATRYVDALAASYDVLLDAARLAGEARVRLSQRLMDEAQQAQQRSLTLVRRLAENPTDLAGNASALVEAAAEAQAQALGITRAWLEGAPEGRQETRALIERGAKVNQDLVRAAFAAARDLYGANPWAQAFRAFTNTAETAATTETPAEAKAQANGKAAAAR